jgi:Glycosyl transferase family 2
LHADAGRPGIRAALRCRRHATGASVRSEEQECRPRRDEGENPDGGRRSTTADRLAPAPQLTDITAVICHYNPTRHVYLQHLVSLCVAALRRIPDERLTILVCDGSPESDPRLAESLRTSDACYLHADRQLTFGETYNLGIEAARTEHVVLVANDILISSRQVRRLVAEVRDDVGCAILYLARADYTTQNARRVKVPRLCYPASMTPFVGTSCRAWEAFLKSCPVALLSIYENGPSVKSIVGATLPSLRASSPVADSTPRKLDGWLTIAEVLGQRHGSLV